MINQSRRAIPLADRTALLEGVLDQPFEGSPGRPISMERGGVVGAEIAGGVGHGEFFESARHEAARWRDNSAALFFLGDEIITASNWRRHQARLKGEGLFLLQRGAFK